MTNTDNRFHDIDDLVQVLNSGIEFYNEAKTKVDDLAIRAVFDDMAKVRVAAVESLQPFVAVQEGERETGGDWAIDTRKFYTKFIAMMSSDKEHTYVKELEEVEDKTLKEFDRVMDKDQPPQFKQVLANIRAALQQCHDQMLGLQKATADS